MNKKEGGKGLAKFCGNCGGKLDDSARVCGYCGFRFVTAPLEKRTTDIPRMTSVKKRRNTAKIKKLLKIILAVIAVLMIFVAGLNIVSAFTGYKGVVRKVINSFEDYDMNTLYSYTSSLCYYSDDIDYYEELFEKEVAKKLDYYEDQLGYNLKISYEIIDSHKLDNRNRNSLLDELEDKGASVVGIDTVRALELKITIKGSASSTTYITDDLWLIKESSGWKVLYKNN